MINFSLINLDPVKYKNSQTFINVVAIFSVSILSTIIFLYFNFNTLNAKFGFNEHSIISDLGLFFWSISVAVTLFTFFLIQDAYVETRKFLLFSSMLSMLLLIDDFLQVHETIADIYLFNEKIYYLMIAAIIILYNLRFIKFILKTHLVFYFTAYLFLFGSLLADGVFNAIEVYYFVSACLILLLLFMLIIRSKPSLNFAIFTSVLLLFHIALLFIDGFASNKYQTLYEESMKWLGICFWCGFYAQTCYDELAGNALRNSST